MSKLYYIIYLYEMLGNYVFWWSAIIYDVKNYSNIVIGGDPIGHRLSK